MTDDPSGRRTTFQLICSARAAAELSRQECADVAQRVVPLAQERDRGVHEGLAFGFDLHGKAWHAVVDLAEGRIKILGTDELEQGVREGVQRN